MSELLKAHNKWENLPVCFLKENELAKEEDDDHNDEVPELVVLEEELSTEDWKEVASGILELSKANIIDDNVSDHLNALHSASFKKIDTSGLPMYEMQLNLSTKQASKVKRSRFVEVHNGDKSIRIYS